MNKERRQELLEVSSILDDAVDRLAEIRDDEYDAYDNLPESFQYGSRGEVMLDAIDSIEAWSDEIENIVCEINKYVENDKIRS